MQTHKFTNLVNGVLWLVRDGKPYVNESFSHECIKTAREEEDAVRRFMKHTSRVAIGHDHKGQIMVVQVDGKTYQNGFTVHEFADFLISLGLINAINLDGGGSVSMVIGQTLANYPADVDYPEPFTKPRTVSTVICVHPPACPSEQCTKSGMYVLGDCLCDSETDSETQEIQEKTAFIRSRLISFILKTSVVEYVCFISLLLNLVFVFVRFR